MKFILVNGRTPRPQSFCTVCCEPINERYLRDVTTRRNLLQLPVLRRAPCRYRPEQFTIGQWRHDHDLARQFTVANWSRAIAM